MAVQCRLSPAFQQCQEVFSGGLTEQAAEALVPWTSPFLPDSIGESPFLPFALQTGLLVIVYIFQTLALRQLLLRCGFPSVSVLTVKNLMPIWIGFMVVMWKSCVSLECTWPDGL